MKQLIVSIFLTVCIIQTYAQSSCRNVDFLNPKDFFQETQTLRKQQQYDEIISLVERKMAVSIELWHYYQLACMSALKGDTVLPFEYIYKHIDLKEFAKDILTDSDFEPLYATRQWQELKEKIISTYLSQYPDITNPELSLQLWLLGIEDQRYRSLKYNYKKRFDPQSKEAEEERKKEKAATKASEQLMENLLKKKIFPTYDMVGEEASNVAVLIIQHSIGDKLFKKALPLLEQAVKQKQANAASYAMMMDRYLCKQGKKQLYGTQLWRFVKKDSTGAYIPGSDYFFCPIEDEKNVNIRRKEMGMETIEEYAISMGGKYVYDPENETLSFKQISKKQYKKASEQWEER